MNVFDLFGEDASGVVANRKQVNDPRYSMSLSPDVRPGEIKRQLKKYNLAEGEENTARLDAILVDLCAGIIKHQKQDSDRYGLVAAAVVDPEHNVVYGINNLQSNGKRVHAERAALANYKQKHGEIPEGSIIVTTLSPCTEPMADREGMSCTELIDTTPIRRVYAGYRDPTQDHLTHDDFDVVVTNNSKLEQLCQGFADCFLKEDSERGGKLVIFDIDDTLVNTNTKVIVRQDGKPVRQLTSQEFTHYKLHPGETFDFGAFSDAEEFARESRPIVPMIQQLNADIAGGNKVVMITARSDFDDRDTFLNAFRRWSVDIDRVHVYRAGNDRRPVSVDAKKADIVRRLLNAGGYSKAIMYDDSKPNLQSFVRLHREYPSTRFYAWHVDHDGQATEYARTGMRRPDAMFEADTAGEITDAVIDFYKQQDIKPQKVDDYVDHAVDLLHQADPTIRGRVREILSRANSNPYIQGGVITTVGALLTGGLLTTASQMHLTPAQTNILLQAVLNTVIPTVVSRVNGKNWIDTVKYTLASAGIGTGIALLSEDTESDVDSIAQEFVEFASERLQFDQMPHIDFVEHVTGTEHPTFGSYDSATDVISIGTSDRHVMDIMRTLAHELVHHKQRETKSELDGGTASRDENQANSVAGTLMREFADQHPEYFGGEQINELGDAPAEHRPNRKRSRSLFHATVDDQWVDVFFDRSEFNDTLHITFTVNGNYDTPSAPTSASKSTVKILSTVLNVIKEKLPEYMARARPPAVSFTAKGENRARVYRKYFVPAIQSILGAKWQHEEYPSMGMTVFHWRPAKKTVDETRIINAERVDVYYRPVIGSRGRRVVARNIPSAALEPLLKKLSEKYAVPVSSFEWSAVQDMAEGKEQFNSELLQKGFHFEQEIGGVTYKVNNKKGGSDNITIEAVDDKGHSIGFARFWMHQYKDGLESLSTQVRDDWQGKGIATNMYAVMRMLGVNIHPASMQSDDGKKMWNKWNKQGDARHIKSMNAKMAENFADGKHPEDKGDSKRYHVPTKASVSTLRKVAKQGGRKGQLAHWMANMKAGRAKARKK